MREERENLFEKETESRAEDCFFSHSLVFVFGFKIITFHRRDQSRKMGRYFTKRMFLLLTPILLLPLLISSSSFGKPVNSSKNGVSNAKEGRFPPSASEAKLPKLADLEFEDLNVCKVFHGKTRCSASRMLSASLAVKTLGTYGEAAKDCLDLFELLECSICQSGTLPTCASFCDRVFEACSDAYVTSDATNKVIVPCGASESIICEKASKWETNGTAFCYAVGFTVQSAVEEEPCYGSNSSLEPPLVVEEEEPLVEKTERSAWRRLHQIYWLITVILVRRICWREIRGRYQREVRALVRRERVLRNMNGVAA